MIESLLSIARRLKRNLAFSALSVLTLALGVGSSTVLFCIIHAALLQPLPFADVGNLRVVNGIDLKQPEQPLGLSYLNLLDLRAGMPAAVAVAGFSFNDRLMSTGADSSDVQVRVALSTSQISAVYGVAPILGRDFSLAEETQLGIDGSALMMISEPLWRSQFQADPNIIGRMLSINATQRRVIGVMPKGLFDQNSAPIDVWISTSEGGSPLKIGSANASRGYPFLNLALARLRPSATPLQLAAQATTAMAQLVKRYPENNAQRGVMIRSVRESLHIRQKPMLLLLLAVNALLFAIVSINLANLVLAHAAQRGAEFQARANLGASMGQLFRYLLLENTLLASFGAALGLALAHLFITLAEPLIRSQINSLGDLHIGFSVALFALALAFLTALMASLGAFWYLRKLVNQQNFSARTALGNASHQRMRKVLVVAQLVLAMSLLFGTALLLQSLNRLLLIDPGFNYQQTLSARVLLTKDRYPDDTSMLAAHARIKDAVRALPSVLGVSIAGSVPLGETDDSTTFNIAGAPFAKDAPEQAQLRFVDADYASSIGLQLLDGRAFGSADLPSSSPVALVNQAFVKRYFPNRNPLGQSLSLGWGGDAPKTIVGVLSDVRHENLNAPPRPEFYVPMAQFPSRSIIIVTRTSSEPKQLMASISQAVRSTDAKLTLLDAKPLSALRDEKMASPRFLLNLIGMVSGSALLLGALGLFGLVSYLMHQRRPEFALRAAIGASGARLRGLLLGQALRLLAIALVIGSLCAWVCAKALQHWLYDVKTDDLSSLALVAAVLSLTTLLACAWPAYRAGRVDLVSALKQGN